MKHFKVLLNDSSLLPPCAWYVWATADTWQEAMIKAEQKHGYPALMAFEP